MELRTFYERTYADEATGGDYTTVQVVPEPSNRFEACVSTVTSRFRGGDLLDLGAGSGLIARSLVAAGLAFDRMIVTDLATPRVENLRSTLPDPRVEAVQLDVERIDHDLGQFDAVIMVALIEHLIDPMATMSTVRGLLRPGGFVYLETPNIAKWTRRLKLLGGRFPSTASHDEGLRRYDGHPVSLYDEGHLHYFSFRSLERMLVNRCDFIRTERTPYRCLPGAIGHRLAHLRPTLFSDVALVAYA